MKYVRHFLLLSLLSCSPPRSSNVHVEQLYASSLARTVNFTVILPESYSGEQRYALLFLLHGYGGSHEDWVARSSLTEYARNLPLIIVLPDANNSWYVNSATNPENRYEDFLINDLRHSILERYAVDTSRTAIAGLSMGGYGAVLLALKHPELFRFAGSLSGALSVPRDIDERERTGWGKHNVANLKETFGPTPGPFRDAHDPLLLYRQTPADRLPYFYFVMGSNDGFKSFLPAHRRLTDSLRSYGALYEYHEVPGGHSWQFWDRHVAPLIVRMLEVLQ